MSDVFLTCHLLFDRRTDAEKYLHDDPLVHTSRTFLTKRPKTSCHLDESCFPPARMLSFRIRATSS